MRRLILGVVAVVVVGALAIQLVPYGRDHTNPPVVAEPAWNSAATRDLAVHACFDCHSNQTTWPWYASIAPASWLTQRHVDEGRQKLNFSEWGTREQKADKSERLIKEGEMPSWDYLLMHPGARLSDAEKQQLVDGLNATFGGGGGVNEGFIGGVNEGFVGGDD